LEHEKVTSRNATNDDGVNCCFQADEVGKKRKRAHMQGKKLARRFYALLLFPKSSFYFNFCWSSYCNVGF
jgi:hypothetical protein